MWDLSPGWKPTFPTSTSNTYLPAVPSHETLQQLSTRLPTLDETGGSGCSRPSYLQKNWYWIVAAVVGVLFLAWLTRRKLRIRCEDSRIRADEERGTTYGSLNDEIEKRKAQGYVYSKTTRAHTKN